MTLGVLVLLLALLIPLVSRSRASAQSVVCLSQLRQIGAGFLQYAAENGSRLPDPYQAGTSWEQLLSRSITTPDLLHCPADGELFPSVGSSYDWRDTGRPETTLAGRAITDADRDSAVLAFEALPGWHARLRMNAVLLDGSAREMDRADCLGDLERPLRPPGSDAAPVAGRPR